MKKLILFSIAVAVLGTACSSPKKAAKNDGKAATAELTSYTDSLSYAVGMLYGSGLKEQLSDSFNVDLLTLVLHDLLKKELPDSAVKINREAATAFLNNHFIQKQEKMAKANREFLENNKTKPGVIALPSGLQYKVITEGTGRKPGPENTVKVHYTGTLVDGRKFDSSVDRGEPISFPLGGVIKGWTEGLQYMSEGSKYILYIPANLAYGDHPPQGSIITPGATLIFEVELLKVE